MQATRLQLTFASLSMCLLGLAGVPALAQDLPEDQCAQLQDPEAEITCLRAVLAATRQAQQGATVTLPVPSPDSSAGPGPANAAAAAPAMPRGEEMGREQLAGAPFEPRAEADREMIVSAIVDFRTDRNGKLIAQLENGQIWRQVDPLGVPIRLDGDDRIGVEITRSGFGGYRMEIPEMGRRFSVSRLR